MGSLKWGKKFPQTPGLDYIFIYVQVKHEYIIPYMYLTTGGDLNHKMFSGRNKPIRISGVLL
jgi:hypothetical protein